MKRAKNSDRKPMSAKEIKAEQDKANAGLRQQMDGPGGASVETDQGVTQGISGPNGASLAGERRLFKCQAHNACEKPSCHHAKPHEWSATHACSTTYWCVPLVARLNPGFNDNGRGMAGQSEYGAEMVRLVKMGLTKTPECIEVTK